MPTVERRLSRTASRMTGYDCRRNENPRIGYYRGSVAVGVDYGASIATDETGGVFAVWHALPVGSGNGEEHRLVWIARSTDDGATFAEETPAWTEQTGACGCCGVRIFAGPANILYLLYR